MKQSAPKLSSKARLPTAGLASASGRVLLELGCWLLGIALIATYFAVSTGLENQRTQGIELFEQARAEAEQIRQQRPEEDDLSVLPTVHESSENEPTTLPAAPSAGASDTDALPIAVLRMDSVGLEVPVYSDLSELNLSRGAGWIDGTAAPNTNGNLAVAAHRDRFFRPLKDVKIGDLLELDSLGGSGQFRVSRIVIVDPDDVSVLDETLVSTVTLVTCYPFYFVGNAPQRYIVQATAVTRAGKASESDAFLTFLPPGESP